MIPHPIYSNRDYLRTLLQADIQIHENPRPQATVWSTIEGVIVVGGLVIASAMVAIGVPLMFSYLAGWI